MSHSKDKPSRHMACNLCRERKVRCDGAQPTCGRCSRLGNECVYNVDRRLSNRDNERRLNETIRTLKEGLSNAEAKLSDREKSSTLETLPGFGFNDIPDNDQAFDVFAQLGDHAAFAPHRLQNVPEEANNDASTTHFFHPAAPRPGQQYSRNDQSGHQQRTDSKPELNASSYDTYFDCMHRCYLFIDRTRFMDAASSPNQTLAFVALKYAVALHSTSLADPGSPNAAALYRAARSSLEAAETEKPGSLSELPFIQTWILIIIYEFRHVDFFRAWMTAGRAIRLAKALHMHMMDAPSPCQQQTRRPGFEPTMSPTCDAIEIENRRYTFWTVFMIDWYGSARTECEMTFDYKEVSTLLPAKSGAPRPSFAQAMANLDSSCSSITPFGAGIITLAVYGRLLHHITLSKSFDLLSTTPSYDFWSEHWRISRLFEQWSACLSHHLSLANAGTDPNIISLHLNTWSISIGQNDVAAVIIERTGCSQAMLQDCQSNSLIAAASIANLIRSAIKANFSFTRLDPGITWSLYMASMACLGALRRTPGDISIMSNLEILLEGFQKFQPVAPRIDTLVSIICQEYESLPPAQLARPVTSSTTTDSSPVFLAHPGSLSASAGPSINENWSEYGFYET